MLAEPPDPWTPQVVAPGTPAYHYTSPAGLLGIMTDRTLWATEVNGLNDTSEVVQGRQIVHDFAARECANDSSNTAMLMLAQAANHQLRTPLTTRVFVISASLDADDAAQWRQYGRERGYVLQIDTGTPLRVVAETSPPPSGLRSARQLLADISTITAWAPVAYGAAEHLVVVESLARWVRMNVPAYLDLTRIVIPDFGKQEVVRQALTEYTLQVLAESVDVAAALLKPEGFRGEHEVRAIVQIANDNEHVRLRANQYGITQYIRLASPTADAKPDGPLPKELHEESTRRPTRALPITGLTVGPTPHFEQTLPALHAALHQAGLPAFNIGKSNVPLRQ